MTTFGERELVPFRAAIDAGVDAVLDRPPRRRRARRARSRSARVGPRSCATVRFRRGRSSPTRSTWTPSRDGRGIDGVADAAVRALHAGADLLVPRFQLRRVDDRPPSSKRVLAALDDGRLDRTSHSSGAVARIARCAPVGRQPPEIAAADRCRGTSSPREPSTSTASCPAGPFAVLECRPRLSMACFNVLVGDRRCSSPSAAGRHGIDRIRRSDRLDARATRHRRAAGDLPLLVVVRDAGVHPWQRRRGRSRCAQRSPGHGRRRRVRLARGHPSQTCGAYVVTHGAARSSAVGADRPSRATCRSEGAYVADISIRGLSKVYPERCRRGSRRAPRGGRRRVPRARRPVGVRQVHAAADDRRPRGGDRRRAVRRRSRHHRRPASRRATSPWCSRATRCTRT